MKIQCYADNSSAAPRALAPTATESPQLGHVTNSQPARPRPELRQRRGEVQVVLSMRTTHTVDHLHPIIRKRRKRTSRGPSVFDFPGTCALFLPNAGTPSTVGGYRSNAALGGVPPAHLRPRTAPPAVGRRCEKGPLRTAEGGRRGYQPSLTPSS